MAIAAFPAILGNIIQQNYLTKKFEQALRSELAYRSVAQKVKVAVRNGQTFTDTRAGLLSTATTPLLPGTNTNFDSGLVPDNYATEQYTLSINRYGKTLDLDMTADEVGIASQFVQNATVLGENARRTLDELARNALFAPYMGGNTRVTVTLGSAVPTVKVDDIRGFQTVVVNGVQTSTSIANPITVTIGANPYQIGTVTADTVNVSTAAIAGGISGTLTTVSGNILVADGTAGMTVKSATAPSIIYTNGKANTSALVATDTLTMKSFIQAKAALEINAVPKIDGFYNCYLDPISSSQLFQDPDFKQIFQGTATEQAAYRAGELQSPFLGLRFIPTTEAFVQPSPSVAGMNIRRPIVVGADALVEGTFAGQNPSVPGDGPTYVTMVDDIRMVVRAPMNRMGDIIAQTWGWIGGYVAPTDLTTNPNTIPTATNAAFKRACIIEHAG